ncbi:Ig-like domain-containing protein [Pseudomonas sp. NPDC085632]|uniref:Ig-like domain-containing protein n=1 Tax=Pseudomonas sp. NPDC085632 TaxID=3364429 RepID=UPI0037C7B734
MLVQPRKQISVLSLLDPEIPGGILLPDGTWGINLAAARLNFIKGLKTQISAWNNMSVGDNCKLLLNKTMVDQKTITDKIEVDKRVTLFVAPERLPSGDWELSYQITRFGQKPEPGPTIKLFVKLELPGGQDINPDYGHSELTMAFDPPDVVRDGVDKATAEEGVLIYAKPKPGDGWLYRNCAVGDVLILAWAGKTVESEPVTHEQLDDPEGDPIVVLADKTTILSAGDSDGVSVSYKIRDRVHNESEDWCEAVRIVVDTQGLRLGAPILKQADGLIVNLEALGDERPQVEVWAEDDNIFKKNDEIYLSVFGTDDEGKEISELVIQRIETTPPVRVSIAHNNSTLRALAKRTVVYAYHVRRGGVVVDNSRSKSRAYSVIGEATRLAAPIAIDQISGALDPNAPEYRIRIPYDPLITPDNAIELKLFGTRSDLTIYDPELDWYFPSQDEADDPEGFIITVAGEHGKTLEGGTLRLSYNLLSDENGTITRRASLHASLLNVGKAQRELVKPIVLGEKDGVLEPKDLPGGVSKITAPRPVAVPTEPYDIVKFFWIVEGNEPVTDSKVLNTLSKDKDVNFPLNAAFVAQHIEPNRGKKVKVNYEIFRAASNTTSYSNDLEFTVGQPVALDPPTIDSVKGSPSGKDIVEGGTTVETSVVLSGMAAKGKNVEIRDGATVKDQVTADPVSGIWTYTASGLSVTKHSFTATGKYGAEPASAAYTLTVTAVIVPTLSNVLDDKNVEIPEGQTTVSTALTLKGTASKGQRVEIFEGNGPSHTSKGVATASTTTGTWELSITVAVGARRLYAGSLYTPRPQWSNVRTLTVTAAAAPTLTSVNGSPSGIEIPQGGVTVETAVTLSGVAAAGREVEVLDGTVIKGKETADGVTGIWSLSVSDLSKAKHSFTARYLEQPSLVSAARTLTVTEATAPTLTSVKGSPSGSEIPQGGETAEKAVTLSGVAAKGQKVEVLDGEVSIDQTSAHADTGAWNLFIEDLSETAHRFTAKGLYGNAETSAPWAITVSKNVDDFTDFTSGNWNNWTNIIAGRGEIKNTLGEFYWANNLTFLKPNERVGIKKTYKKLKRGGYQISFSYKYDYVEISIPGHLRVDFNGQLAHHLDELPANNIWKSTTGTYYYNAENQDVVIEISCRHNRNQTLSVPINFDNITIKRLP